MIPFLVISVSISIFFLTNLIPVLVVTTCLDLALVSTSSYSPSSSPTGFGNTRSRTSIRNGVILFVKGKKKKS